MSPRKEALFKTAAVVGSGILFFSLPIIFPGGPGLTLMLFIVIGVMAAVIIWVIYAGFLSKAEQRQREKERNERWDELLKKPRRYGGAK